MDCAQLHRPLPQDAELFGGWLRHKDVMSLTDGLCTIALQMEDKVGK